MENVCGIHAVEMAGVLGSKNVQYYLIIDCRSFLSFNQGRILESINIHCPPILKRRSGGFISLENIVPCEQKRNLLLSGVLTNVLVYDENTEDLTQVPKDSNLLSVIKSLLQQITNVTVRFVIGGFEAMRDECPALCVEQVMTHINRERACRDGSNRNAINYNTTTSFREPAEILPHLYLGDESHSSQRSILDRLGITALVNVSSSCNNHFEDNYRYMNIHIDDSMNADLSSWFPEVINFIDEVAAMNGKVLVHCWAGISRSATVCIAYIMQKQRVSLEKAFDFVLTRRSVIDPNLNFIQQLQRFETQCLQHQEQGSQIQRHQLQFPSSTSSQQQLIMSAHHHIPPPSPRPSFQPSSNNSSSVFSFSPVSPTAHSSTSSTNVLSRLTSLVPYSNSNTITSSQIRRNSSSGNLNRSENIKMSLNLSSSEKQQDLSPSSLSQTAASPNPLRVAPSRPSSLPILQLNASSFPSHHHHHHHPYHIPQQQQQQQQHHQYSLSPIGMTGLNQGTELQPSLMLSHQQAQNSNNNNNRLSPLSPLFDFTTHQLEDEVAVAIPVVTQGGAAGSFDFFTRNSSTAACCPPVTLPSPHHPTASTTAQSHDTIVSLDPSFQSMGMEKVATSPIFPSPISPRAVPRSPLSPVPSFG